MSQNSSIEWTDATWNPWHGCHKISPGCKFCYMYRDKERYGQDPNIVVRSKATFSAPLKWREPRMIFTCSWSDWLIEEADPWREEAYEIIRQTPQHTYQILTKRIERGLGRVPDPPLPNVWLGVSVENQQYADERIPVLLQTPAAVRFVSYEPALGPVDFCRFLFPRCMNCDALLKPAPNGREIGLDANLPCGCNYCWHCADNRGRHENHDDEPPHGSPVLDWVIVGGESGHDARPFDIAWARSVIDQCREAGVACFVKQLGASAFDSNYEGSGCDADIDLRDRKGGDWEEWPLDLRVREFPARDGAEVRRG